MHEKIEAIATASEEARDKWNEVFQKFNDSALGVDRRYSRLSHSTLRELNRRVLATLELTLAVRSLDENGEVLLLPKADSLTSAINAIKSGAATIIAAFDSFPDAPIADPSNSLETVQFMRAGAVVSTQALGASLDAISNNAAAAWDALALVVRHGRNKALPQLVDRATQLQGVYERFTKLIADTTDARNALVGAAKEAAAQSTVSAASATESKASADSAKSGAKEAKESAAEALAKLEKVRELSTTAASLQTQIDAYAGKFDAFQKSLDARLSVHVQFEASTKAAEEANSRREAEIDRLTTAADSMIQGATTAGLGYTLEQTRKLYAQRMTWARVGFVVAIVLLAVSAVPLLAQLLPGLFRDWLPIAVPSTGGKATDELYLLLGKVFLLFPATWLTQFYSKSFSEFFHLEREYAHKAALAQSVEGFKRQAPNYEQEITAEVFREVTANPSKQASPEPASHPLYDVLAKKLLGKLPGGASSEAKQS